MTNETRQDRARLKWFSIDGPLLWLMYLPLFFIPWVFRLPSTPQILWAIAGLAVFLVIYIRACTAKGNALILYAALTLLISFGLIYTNSNWTVIAVYAAAMVGELRPPRRAGIRRALLFRDDDWRARCLPHPFGGVRPGDVAGWRIFRHGPFWRDRLAPYR